MTMPQPNAIHISPLGVDEDLSALGAWLADPRIARGLNIVPRTLSAADLRRYVASFDGASSVIMGIRAGAMLVGIATFDINPRHRTAQWSLVVGHRDFRQKETLLEAGLHLFDWAYGPAGLDKVSSRLAATKMVLAYLYESVGIRREGYLRGEILLADGSARQDELVFGLLRSDWPVVRANIVSMLHGAEKAPDPNI